MTELTADQPRAELGDRIGFTVALLLGAGVAVLVGHGDVEGSDAQTIVGIVVKRVEGHEGR